MILTSKSFDEEKYVRRAL